MTTEERVAAARDGDDEAFYELVRSGKERLYRIAYAYLKNESDALEAIQEATCRAYVQLRKLKEPRYFHTWFTRILIHCCIDERKRRRRVIPVRELPEPLAHDLSLDDRIGLSVEIDRLAPKYRHIIILKYYEDMTLTDISSLLEKPEGTIKTWLNKALKQLRSAYGRKGGGEYA